MRIGHGEKWCKGEDWSKTLHEIDETGVLEIDLCSALYVASGFLVRLACVVDAARSNDVPVTLTSCPPGHTPSSTGAAAYASRLGLKTVLDNLGVGNDLLATGKNDPDHRFVELSRFGGTNTPVDEVIDVVFERVVDTWDDAALTEILYFALYELALNIEQHACRSGFVMAQWFSDRASPVLELCVADAGIGIRESLNRSGHQFVNDADAIEAAATTKLTSKPKDGGFGLRNVRDSVTGLKGSVTIQSNAASLTSIRNRFYVRPVPMWWGTVIDARFPWSPKQ